jgi:hypothetical protein
MFRMAGTVKMPAAFHLKGLRFLDMFIQKLYNVSNPEQRGVYLCTTELLNLPPRANPFAM